MFNVRPDEPKYAFLQDKTTEEKNRYGLNIETVAKDDSLRDVSLNINGDDGIGDNPNRYKQHGFFFTADNCIACHACEAACSEKNDNPGHIAFRSVGFVEGGTYPDYRRLNISMACNHCDDPVCLKGCPTRAYTKFAEYGAVLQDPDICFGCGYCTWVCPYNAPQMDPVKGQVSKCNMCVDRLEVGLKPACVSACLGKALEFGVIENKPEDRTQAKAEIPGFPTTDITHPNIRFQQTKTLQRDMVRVDSTNVKYHRDDDKGQYESTLDAKQGQAKHWGLDKLLGSHENAHVMFTLSVQAVMGAFFMLFVGGTLARVPVLTELQASSAYIPLLFTMLVLMAFGLFKLNMHLGKPHRFYRGFNNLRLSPVSREIAGVSLFFAGLAGFAVFSFLGDLFVGQIPGFISTAFGFLGLAGFALGSYYMYKLYRIKARPFWDHWQTASSFYGTMLSMGSLLIALVAIVFMQDAGKLVALMALLMVAGLALESFGLLCHAKDLKKGSGEGAAAHYEQTTQFGKSYRLRNLLLVTNMLLAVAVYLFGVDSWYGAAIAVALLLSTVVMAYIGRIIFYALVIPTTMPGAFFWRNKGFVDHARETGLADMQQLGVAYESHHKFDVKELLKTIRENSPASMLAHVRWIFTGK